MSRTRIAVPGGTLELGRVADVPDPPARSAPLGGEDEDEDEAAGDAVDAG
jgi:hypothetical protein